MVTLMTTPPSAGATAPSLLAVMTDNCGPTQCADTPQHADEGVEGGGGYDTVADVAIPA